MTQDINIEETPETILTLKDGDTVVFQGVRFKVEECGYNSEIFFNEIDKNDVEIHAKPDQLRDPKIYPWRHIRYYVKNENGVDVGGAATGTRKQFYTWVNLNQVKVW
jgi:hypothetical protein